MKSNSTLLALLFAIFALYGGPLPALESRTWSDSTGKYKIEGTFRGSEGGKVTIERNDGSLVEIELTKLSAADQKYVLEDASPFKPVEANSPFKPKRPRPHARSRDADPAPTDPEAITPDWSAAESIALMPAQDAWKIAVPAAAPPREALKSRAIPLPPKTDFWEGVKGFVVSASGHRAAIGYKLDKPEPGKTRIVLCDLVDGKKLVSATADGAMIPVALDDRGTQVLMRRDEWGWGKSDRLELWELSPTGIDRSLVWYPYGDEKDGHRDVKWAAFVGEERLATLGGSGKLVLWNAKTAQPQFHLPIDAGSLPALSQGRKYLAFSTGKQVGLLDLTTNEVVALQSIEHLNWAKLCFSPDGSKLACLAHARLIVWDVDDGSVYRDIPLAGLSVGTGEMIWPHERYLLLGKSTLFDIDNQVPLWTYRGHELVELAGNLCAFVVHEGHDKPGALVLAPIPAPSFEQTLAAAQKQPDFFVLRPGVTVRLNLDGLPDAAEREKVREALTQKLQDRGCNVGPEGTIELVASAEAGKEQEVSYHGFGISPFRSYKVREYFSKLAFVYQGKVTWQTAGNNVPGFIQLKEGETIEQVLRRSERPNYAFYRHVELPKMLMKPMGEGGLGSSRIGVSGVQ
jgi:hypothetical protein